jgi:LacI family transcriptional regulator
VQLATLKEVSELAGVSQATVSRVINGTNRVSHDKKLNVVKAINKLGYRPHSIVQALSCSRTASVGVIVPELGGPFYSTILDVIDTQLRQLGYHVIVSAGSNTEAGQKESVKFLLSRRVDALIVHAHQLSNDYLIELQQSGVPLVILNRVIPEMNTSCISIDNELGGKLVTEHLLEMGHENIVFITGPLDKPDARARLQGYRNALYEAGIAFDDALIGEGDFTEASGVREMRKILNRNCQFTAVFASNDYIALGASEVLIDKGYSIPDQVSLVGFDNINFARYMTPKLTSVHFPIEQMSMESVQLIIQKLNKNKCDVSFKLLPSLVRRDSVKNLHTTLNTI